MGVTAAKQHLCNSIDIDDPDQVILTLKTHTGLANAIIDDDCRHTPLTRAIEKRNYVIANILLGEFRADPNQHEGHFSPLMIAAMKDSVDLIQLLIHFKAKINKTNKRGLSAVDYAIIYGSYRVLTYFKEYLGVNMQKHFENYRLI